MPVLPSYRNQTGFYMGATLALNGLKTHSELSKISKMGLLAKIVKVSLQKKPLTIFVNVSILDV